ncbi:MAG: hypothetical protein KDJ35_02925 [Alphaproteobacteria bacterium]|nr:hypothetical protein [Alphaproteobacteria bacterium]
MILNQSMIWNSLEAAIVTGGRNSHEWCASGVCLNIDDVRPGDLFFASREDDLNKVFEKGAAAVVLSHCMQAELKLPYLSVPSVYEALQAMARAARFKSHASIFAVQGKEERKAFAHVLSKAGSVHKAGKHLSLALAGLPMDVDYGVFVLSPAVQPDIAVITKCAAAHRDTLFEQMPAHGTVLVNADDEEHLSIISRAKAAGLQEVYTFSVDAPADAQVLECVDAGNGCRITVKILDQEHSAVLPSGSDIDEAFVAALLALRLTGKCVSSVLKTMGKDQGFINQTGNGITLADPALGGAQAVFRITNMIDLGSGRQTAILDNVAKAAHDSLTFPKKSLAIPRKMANLDFVYTSKRLSAVSNAREAIRKSQGAAKIETITPDVIAPGDFLVFKDVWTKSKAVLSEVLRCVPETGKT